MAFFVLEYRDNLPIKGPPVLNSYSTPFSFSRFPASPHQSNNRPPSVQFDPLDPPFSGHHDGLQPHNYPQTGISAMEKRIRNIEHAVVLNLTDMVTYQPGQLVSKTPA